jgi:tetratricopeptide (TPR) repeat protein
LYTDFLVNISFFLTSKDKVKLLRLALTLADPGTVEYARVLFELLPFLSVDDKRRYGDETLKSSIPSLLDLVVLSSCFDYLPREDVTRRIKSYIESLQGELLATDSCENRSRGFTSFILQNGLALTIEFENDPVSVTASIARQKELLDDALKRLGKSRLWSGRIKLAQAWILYWRALRTPPQKMLELFGQSSKGAIAALKVAQKLHDYQSLFSGFRLLFIISYRVFLFSDSRRRKMNVDRRRMRKYARLSIEFAEAMLDPVKSASAYSNLGVMLWGQAELHSDPRKRRRLLEEAREQFLKAVLTVRSVNAELAQLPLFNAGLVLCSLSELESDVVKYNELLEGALKEMEDIIKSSSDSTAPRIRVSAITTKLLCMDELARINPVNVTHEDLKVLDHIDEELEELRSRTCESYLFAYAYQNLSLYCLRLLRAGGKDQKQLLDKAEKSALKAYEISEEISFNEVIGGSLYNIAAIQLIRAILDRDVKLLTKAGQTVKRSCEVLQRIGDLRFLVAQSFGIEVQVMKYGYTGDPRELDRAIALSRKSVSDFISQKYPQLAGEELFRLATLYMLAGADKKAENSLIEAAKQFRESGEENPRFRKDAQDFSMTCNAMHKLVQAQMAFKAGKQSKARRLAEEAEKEMTRAKARWREIWLIRGFKELIAGNLREAKASLTRIIKESLEVLEDKNPTSTGYTARRLMDFIDQERGERKVLPPTSIDLPLKSEAILAALRIENLNKQISSVPAASSHMGARELNIEDIREIIKETWEDRERKRKKNERKMSRATEPRSSSSVPRKSYS